MIQLSLVALSIVLIGLQCKHLAMRVHSGLRPTDALTPESMRALMEQARCERAAQEQA
jgi:hypothetical protein